LLHSQRSTSKPLGPLDSSFLTIIGAIHLWEFIDEEKDAQV